MDYSTHHRDCSIIFQKTVIHMGKTDSAMICAAIDFGTTFSGYAYSFKSNPSEVFTGHWKEETVAIKVFNIIRHTLLRSLNWFLPQPGIGSRR